MLRDIPKYSDFLEKEISACKKNCYPHSTKSVCFYLFFIFDPVHYGHCYGFHIIQNEGCKDEYCLNREPQFWRGCHFWHDVFHGYHPLTYNSRRIESLKTVNSEVCEQLNSYVGPTNNKI